jgi:mono/diheme cytochrome c family protein
MLARLLAGALPGLTALALLAPPALATTGATPDLEDGRRTFESVCAACHGPTGRPDPENPTVKALDPQPADLSDPLFNSREPAEDWRIVVTHGGQALGLSATMLQGRAR